MAKIVLSIDGKIVDQRFLDASRFTIGRDAGCDMIIDTPDTPDRQAVISTVVNDHFIENQGPEGSLLVNGKIFARHLLQNGDIVFLQRHRLKYLNTSSNNSNLDRTQLLTTEQINDLVSPAQETPLRLGVASASAQATRDRLARGRLVGIGGQYIDREIAIERLLIAVGTRGECVAVINRRLNGCYLSHVSGSGRTKLNGRPVGNEAVHLADGDVIEAGADKVVFYPA